MFSWQSNFYGIPSVVQAPIFITAQAQSDNKGL